MYTQVEDTVFHDESGNTIDPTQERKKQEALLQRIEQSYAGVDLNKITCYTPQPQVE